MSQPTENIRVWRCRSHEFRAGRLPLLMGIVNVTPDSFSDGGDCLDSGAAVAYAGQLIEDGADILDIGGESTRPGATPVPADEELRRVIPVIERLARKITVPISIDTTKSDVARRALDAGAAIVNDISGLTFDDQMPGVCRQAGAGIVCMHIRGRPQTMQNDPQYGNVVEEIRNYFAERLQRLQEQGISPEAIVFDPGIGFGKTAEHNLEILRHIGRFHDLGRPILIGHSRKRFLGTILDRRIDERISGTIGVAIALAAQSTDILRVHDVRAVRDALLAWKAVEDRRIRGDSRG